MVPIRKIGNTNVAITSYFGKSFITKAEYKKDDVGFWFRKKIAAAAEVNKKIKNVVFMKSDIMDDKLPLMYSQISRYVKMFNIGNLKYSFDYKNRGELSTGIKSPWKLIEPNGFVLVGRYKDSMDLVLMDKQGKLFHKKASKLTELPSIFEQLGIDHSGMPIESAGIKIFKSRIPIVVLLAYYLGLNKLIKLLKAKVKVLDRGKRYTLEENEYVIVFKDKKLILNTNDKLATMILGGLTSIQKDLKTIELELLNKKNSFIVLFNTMGLMPLYINEIKIMENMFVDPITKSILTDMKEPTTFKGLLIKSAELLLDDNYKNPKDSSGMLIKGYERISGMLYKELVSSVRDFENKNTFSKAKITMDPFAVWRDINDDSTSMLVDDLNPIANLKQEELITALGSGGRTKESMSMATRVLHPSEVGVVSEGVKDSGDVGISAYMSANPNIKGVRGMVDNETNKLDSSNILSTSALLAPAADNDDPKRIIL